MLYYTTIGNPKLRKYLGRTKMAFGEINPWHHKFLTIHQILEDVCSKNLEATISFIDFSQAFDSIHRGKMEQILLIYRLPKETDAAIMMLYKNMKVKVHSPDGDTDYFNIVAGVLQGDTLAPYLLIICLDYVLRTSIDLNNENSFQERSRRYLHKLLWMRIKPMT